MIKQGNKNFVTKEGKFFLIFLALVSIFALGTGSNLLILLFCLLTSLLALHLIVSALCLANLRVVRKIPKRAQTGVPHVIEIEVANKKKYLSSFAVEVEDLRENQPADKRCFFLKIGAASSQIAAYKRTPSKRGVDKYSGFRVATRFPFGFFERSLILKKDEQLVIYPATQAIPLEELMQSYRTRAVPMLQQAHSLRQKNHFKYENIRRPNQKKISGSDEFSELRALREGEDWSLIYWKKSASSGQLLVRENSSLVATKIVIELCLTWPRQSPTHSASCFEKLLRSTNEDTEGIPEFEAHIKHVASMLVAHVKQGHCVELWSSSGVKILTSPETGTDRAMRYLAVARPHEPHRLT